MRVCRNTTGPGESSLTISAINAISGSVATSITPAAAISRVRVAMGMRARFTPRRRSSSSTGPHDDSPGDGSTGARAVGGLHVSVMVAGRFRGAKGALGARFAIGEPVVVRIALQDAASVAGLLITTEAMIAERPKKESHMPAMPGSGMGGMDY